MKKIIIFNWKMFPKSMSEARRLVRAYASLKSVKAEIIIAPPFVYLSELFKIKNSSKQNKFVAGRIKVKIAAQNTFWEDKGAYTGEISPKMLQNLGVEYVIIGHSERRNYIGETDAMINKKFIALIKRGLAAVLCVGEPIEVRKKGGRAATNFIKNQLQRDLTGIEKLKFKNKNLIVAYEPIWAIGTGFPAHPNDALEMIKYIKKILTTNYRFLVPKVLYGGSVNGNNILDFVKYKEIDGALVGGASLIEKEIKIILERINTISV